MVALLGPTPPQVLADSGSCALVFFNEGRSTKGEILNESLESVLTSRLERVGQTMMTEESEAFLAFLQKTSTWTQNTRAHACELINDPWLPKIK
jgi:hypothetical protein